MLRIALITPINKEDYLVNTLVDGLLALESEGKLEFKISSQYPTRYLIQDHFLARRDFIAYSKRADLIILCWGKQVQKWKFFIQENTDFELAEEINEWQKTVYVDGSEVGRDGRARGLVAPVNEEMLAKCAAYFKREKPYAEGVTALPFGIESSQVSWREGIKKDIDFFCVFGQYSEYLPLREQVTNELEKFCKENNFSCVTDRMPREEFLGTLARSKVGVSVGGGGYDTARFWEILGNNCLLLTENIDIYPDNGQTKLNYERITQFKDIEDFKKKLTKVGEYLRSGYLPADLESEYKDILAHHSSRARVETILASTREKGILT